MTTLAITHVEVYVFRRKATSVELLALRRSPGRKLGGVWQPVTGKRKRAETIFAAAAREVLEETGLTPRRWWLLEPPLLHFARSGGGLHVLPRFAAEVARGSAVTRSAEHDDHAFLSLGGASRRFLWESQREATRMIARDVLPNRALARALEVSSAEFRRRSTRT